MKTTTPPSIASTNTTESSSTTGTASSVKASVKKLNMDDSVSEDDNNPRKPIEEIPFVDIRALRAYLVLNKPDKRTYIMTEKPTTIVTMALQDYPAQTLKGLLSYFKAKYRNIGLGGIEEHETKTKQMLIKELLLAIGKIKVCNDQKE